MSIATAVPLVSPDDPRLLTPSPDYSLLDSDGRLASRYASHLSQDSQAYVLRLAELGRMSAAEKAAACNRMGTVDRRCERKRYAHGQRIKCHTQFCRTCGRAGAKLGNWLRNRDLQRILSVPLFAFELTIPISEEDATYETTLPAGDAPATERNHRPHDPMQRKRPSHLSPLAVRRVRDRLAALASQLLAKLGLDAVSMDRIDPRNTSSVSIRVATNAHLRYSSLAAEWRAVAGGSAWCKLNKEDCGSKLLHWVFSGIEPALMMPGDYRAELDVAFEHLHLVRTRGSHFSVMSEEELKARTEERAATVHMCTQCSEPHPLEVIPPGERSKQEIDEVEREYAVVDWHSDYDPFAERRAGVIGRVPSTDKFAYRYRDIPESRYGPS